MESYLWQSALLMLVAYFLGAVLGCILRRLLTSGATATQSAPGRSTVAPATHPAATPSHADMREAPEPVQPRIETVAQATPPQDAKIAESARFERVLTSAPAVGEKQKPAPVSSATAAAAPAAPESLKRPEPATPAGSPQKPAAATSTATTAAAAAAAAVAASTARTEPAAGSAETRLPTAGGSGGQSAVAATIAKSPADDLRRIGNIDEKTANALNQLGYTHFSDIAGWTAADAAKVRGALGNRAAREGWFEQAKILADGKDTGRLRRLAGKGWANPWPQTVKQPAAAAPAAPAAATPKGPTAPPITWQQPPPGAAADKSAAAAPEASSASAAAHAAAIAAAAAKATPASAAPTPAAPTPAATAPAPAAPAATAPAANDDLKRIQGIDAAAEKLLQEKGVKTYAQISKWTAAHVEKVGSILGHKGRITRENWIEQAKVLADGKETAFTQRSAGRPNTTPAPGPLPAPNPLPRSTIKPAAGAAAAAPAPATATAAPAKPQTAAAPATLAAKDQPAREGSIASSKGVATAPFKGEISAPPVSSPPPAASAPTAEAAPAAEAAAAASAARPARLADAIRQNTGAPSGSSVSGMRSVRSQLLAGEPKKPSGEVEDLKKIRGIGVLIEKKLNAMGVYTYEQIANWSAGDIERMSSALDFKGRIEREGWVQQARILASGGQTEFSKRL